MKKNILSVQSFWLQPRKKSLISAFFVLIISLLLGRQISLYNDGLLLDEKHQAISSELDIYGNSLTIALNSYFGALEGIHNFIQVEKNLPTSHIENSFNHLAVAFSERIPGIRNFSVAKNGVQTYVYPLEGNENVLGHDLINDERPEVRADVARAIQTKNITLSGPYELRQGGLGLVARKAVYDEELWGLVAMVIDVPPILASAGLSENDGDLVLTLQDKNGDVFWGDSTILDAQPIQYHVVLPDGYWTLSAAPRSGWDASSPNFLLIKISVVLVSVMLALLTYLLVNRDERLQHNVAEKTRALSDVVTELEASEKKYRDLIEFAQEGIWLIDKNSVTVFVNPSMGKMLGYENEEIIGKELFFFMDERGIEIAKKKVDQRKEGIAEQHDFELIRKDGQRIIVAMETAPITDENGEYAGAIAGVIDITQRKRMEQKLQESEKRFRSLFDDSADAYLILDENIFVDCNQATIEMLRANSKEEVLSTHPSQLSPEFQPDGRSSGEKADEMIRIALELGSNRFEWVHRRKDGEDFYVEVLLTPIVVGDKTIIHAAWRDITGQKKANQEILDTRNRLESIFKSAPAGIGVVIDRKIQFANQRFMEMIGYTEEELLGNSARLFYPNDKEFERAGKEKYEQIAGLGTGVVETTFQKKDGSLMNILLSSTAIYPDDLSAGVTFSALDITERKSAEKALKTLNIELDERVGQRTKELHQTISAMADREIRMIELKKVITQLRTQIKKAGLEPEAYDPLLGPDKEW